jgi:hypothetical protein
LKKIAYFSLKIGDFIFRGLMSKGIAYPENHGENITTQGFTKMKKSSTGDLHLVYKGTKPL